MGPFIDHCEVHQLSTGLIQHPLDWFEFEKNTHIQNKLMAGSNCQRIKQAENELFTSDCISTRIRMNCTVLLVYLVYRYTRTVSVPFCLFFNVLAMVCLQLFALCYSIQAVELEAKQNFMRFVVPSEKLIVAPKGKSSTRIVLLRSLYNKTMLALLFPFVVPVRSIIFTLL